MFKNVKKKLRKQANKFKLRLSREKLDESHETENATSKLASTNPFDLDEDDEYRIVDDDESANRINNTNSSITAARLHLEAKKRLLLSLEPYCYSTDPLAPHRTLRPAVSEYAQSILTRSREVESAQKWNIVRAHLHRENEPTMLLSRRCWSQNDLNDLRRGGPRRSLLNGATTTRSHHNISGTTKRSVLKRIQTLVAARQSKSNRHLSVSDTNLSSVGSGIGSTAGQMGPMGASRFYCPNGVYNRTIVLRQTVVDEETARQALMRRWKTWTTKMRRPRRVGDAASGVGP